MHAALLAFLAAFTTVQRFSCCRLRRPALEKETADFAIGKNDGRSDEFIQSIVNLMVASQAESDKKLEEMEGRLTTQMGEMEGRLTKQTDKLIKKVDGLETGLNRLTISFAVLTTLFSAQSMPGAFAPLLNKLS